MKFVQTCRVMGWWSISLGLIGLVRLGADDTQAWTALIFRQSIDKNWSVLARVEPRWTDDVGELGTLFLRAGATRRINAWATLSLDYTHLEVRSKSRTAPQQFRGQDWAGIGVTAKWNAGERWTFTSRNNLHVRSIEGRAATNVRTRHYVEAAWRLAGSSRLRAIYAGNEVFVELAGKTARENRLTPLGLRWQLSSRADLSTFYMIRATESAGAWKQAHVLGTYCTIKLGR